MPEADELLTLDGFRDRKADGFHPSVRIEDAEDTEWKVKLSWETKIATEAAMSRIFYALGYNTEPEYASPVDGLRLEARALAKLRDLLQPALAGKQS